MFLEKPGQIKISVDRLSIASPEKAMMLAENAAVSREANFCGWAVVVANKAVTNGRRVVSSPMPARNNPYHADIILSDITEEDREEQKRHAQKLADNARWVEKP